MRCLKRNMQPFKYAHILSQTEMVDTDGNYTGETDVQYTTPVTAYANINALTGAADVEAYGTRLKYDRTLVMSVLPEGMDETTVLWLDNLDSDTPDYVVLRISKSLNFVEVGAMRKDRT